MHALLLYFYLYLYNKRERYELAPPEKANIDTRMENTEKLLIIHPTRPPLHMYVYILNHVA